MSDPQPPTTTDLLLLIFGLQQVIKPDGTAHKGEDYYLNPPVRSDERTLRETKDNVLWLRDTKTAWDSVRFRDWLITTLFGNIADHKQELTAISENLVSSMDVLGKEFTHNMPGNTDAINQAMVTKSGYSRSYYSALTFGISQHDFGGKDLYVFGAGFRRRARLWLTDSEALQADVEYFMPFYVIPNSDHPKGELFKNARSVCAGLAISKSNGTAIGEDGDNELVAMRFNLRIPFTMQWKSETKEALEQWYTVFGDPEIKIQKRVKAKSDPSPKAWETYDNWEKFLNTYCKTWQVADLLNSPIGPLLLEKISDPAGVTDILLKQSKRDDLKKNIQEAGQDLKDTVDLLKSVWEWQPPKKDPLAPHSSQRKLGSLLGALGLMTSSVPSGGEIEYTFKIDPKVTVWTVLNGILDELDGFPLWIKGLNPKKRNEPRIALTLASQSEIEIEKGPDARTGVRIETGAKKHFFGLAGVAYNIPLKPASKKKPAKKDPPKKTEVAEEEATIVLSDDNFTEDESILIDREEEEQEEQEGETGVTDDVKPSAETEAKKSRVEVLLHLGKWFTGESLDDNWYQRLLPKAESIPGKQRTPLPGIRFLPIKKGPKTDRNETPFTFTFRIDLISFGVDIQGTTKDGLAFLEGLAGHFGLGAIEIRLAVKISAEDVLVEKNFLDRVSIGIGVKLRDLRLSLGPKEEDEKKKKKPSGNEIMDGLKDLLADDWVEVPKPEGKVKTRLTAKKKDKFSISAGYLTPLKKGSHGTLDIQIYDEKGNRGKMAIIPIDRQAFGIYLRQIGIGLKGVENVELSQGLPESAKLIVSLTGGIRLPVFELGFIGAKLILPLRDPAQFQFALDGLDVSVKIGPVVISGSFMKVGIEFAGSLTIEIPKGSFSAMGFYGSMRVFNISRESEIITELNAGTVHKKLAAKLKENEITPAAQQPIRPSLLPREWELHTVDNKQYIVTDEDDKVNVLRQDKTFFVYGILSAANGGGPTLGPIQLNAIVFGYGYNRRVKIPVIEKVAEHPFVVRVMSEGGYQFDDTSIDWRAKLAKPLEDPISVLEKMKDHIVPELGQQFACAGARFTLFGMVDCFALLIFQFGGGEFEISLLGLARFRKPREINVSAIAYVEMQLLMTIKPKEGAFKLQALLTSNSWIINRDCKLTGGFALFIWFDGKHKGDLVFTLGGYHPRFRRPEHYPVIPRLGLNWPVNRNLTIKGGVYLALTPSCGMLGAKLEATFHSERISAWFTAYLDVIVNWDPISFEAEIGISLGVEVSFFLTSLKLTIAASIQMWGPPVGGIARVDLHLIAFDIPLQIEFGTPRPKQPELVKTWQQFCHNLLSMSGGDRKPLTDPVTAFPIVQPNLAGGRNNLNNLPNTLRDQKQPKPQDAVWKVRADELEFTAATVVPVTNLNVGSVKNSSPPEGVPKLEWTGVPLMNTKPVVLETAGLQTRKSANPLGVHPMDRKLQSVLNVTVVRDDVSGIHSEDVSAWTFEQEISSLPAALWDSAKPNLKLSEPSAKLIDGCISGIKRLKPPNGKLGKRAAPPKIEWHQLKAGEVIKSEASQEFGSSTRSRNVQQVVIQKKGEQQNIVNALSAAGFSLEWKPQEQIRFRELQAEPLAGAVAA